MRLSIANQPIAIPEGATISIEKSSPVLTDDGGTFSYPFPVPTPPNHQALGWPGELARIWEIPNKSFILEDQGIQVLTGEIEYDQTDENEIGVILKSGSTEFYTKIKGVKLPDIDFGSQAWFPTETNWNAISAKLEAWDTANATPTSPYIVAPFLLNNADKTDVVLCNKISLSTGLLANASLAGSDTVPLCYMFQFRLWWLVEQIFTANGYTVVSNCLKDDDFKELILFTKPFYFFISPSEDPQILWVTPVFDNLEYSKLMPDVEVQDLLDAVKAIGGLVYSLDGIKKEVSIFTTRSLFSANNIEQVPLTELKGWQHREHETTDGYQISYQSQEKPNDTESRYTVNNTVQTTLPAASTEGIVIHVTDLNKDFITVKGSGDTLKWEQIGRLKPYVEGNGGFKIEIPVMVPQSADLSGFLLPKLEIDPSYTYYNSMMTAAMENIYVALYRGVNSIFNNVPIPFVTADYRASNAQLSLVPADLFADLYDDYLEWKSTRSRAFTKYLYLSLPQLLALQWNKRYFISGIRVVLEKINYELPFTGLVKVDGYTA